MTTTAQPEATTAETTGFAEITEVSVGLPPTERCIRCGAQAYVEVQMTTGTEFVTCAHHYRKHESALALQAKRIIDHRPFLLIQERAFRGMTS